MKEVYEALLILRLLASVRKVEAGLRYAASGEHQSYPSGVLELGVVLDAIDMIVKDVLMFISESDEIAF